ncbi:MAG: hypothetical protein JOY77_11590 [Alphaproteobacteria bacterium]|nr:hypothetical protein [Alphaproteobacteria bacterium]MBV9063552.1 hypothetical protein [Alphaproteobacteria bacterium]
MRLAILGLVLALCGCGVFPTAADRAVRNSPNFRAGYDDGCAAASTRGANPREDPYRDEDAYQKDRAYHSGWSNGFAACRSDLGANPVGGSAFNPAPGQH